jgi:hypothetical protein
MDCTWPLVAAQCSGSSPDASRAAALAPAARRAFPARIGGNAAVRSIQGRTTRSQA